MPNLPLPCGLPAFTAHFVKNTAQTGIKLQHFEPFWATNCYPCCKMFLIPRYFAVGRERFPADVSGFACAFAVVIGV